MSILTHVNGISVPADLTTSSILIVRGRAAILAAQPLLAELARMFSQPGAADYVDYFLTQPYTGGKIPHLVLVTSRPTESLSEIDPAEILGAVLLHEYQIARIPLNIFVTEDYAGERNVLAPEGTRSAIAVRAAEHLISCGAHLVVLSLKDATFEKQMLPPAQVTKSPVYMWGTVERTLTRRLPLAASYDATLATLGAHTRRNLRYYRRRVEDQLHCTFVPEANITEEQFVALNRVCSYPTPDAVSNWRYRSAHSVTGGLFAGIQAANGDWLSVVGGRRSHCTTSIDWQMNQTRFSNLSLSTVMRSYLIEQEIAAGATTLLFEGGTPHSMQLSFPPDHISDFVAARGARRAQLLRRFAAVLLRPNNFLVQTLARKELVWRIR